MHSCTAASQKRIASPKTRLYTRSTRKTTTQFGYAPSPKTANRSREIAMARFTEVSNSKLCPGVTKTLKDWYVDAVTDFASKYANKTTITIPANCEKWEGHVKNGNDRLDLQGSENGYGN